MFSKIKKIFSTQQDDEEEPSETVQFRSAEQRRIYIENKMREGILDFAAKLIKASQEQRQKSGALNVQTCTICVAE